MTQQRTTTRSNPTQDTCYNRGTLDRNTATTVRAPLLTLPRFTPCGRLVKRMPTRTKAFKRSKTTNEPQKHTRTPTDTQTEKRTQTTTTKRTTTPAPRKTRVKYITEPRKTSKKTSKTHKNPNGKPRPKLQRETNTHDDNKENLSTDSFTTRMKPTTEPRKTGENIENNTHRKPRN